MAIDWSGRKTDAAEFIWLAEAAGNQLIELRNGLSREEVIDHLIASASGTDRLAVGFDFAFSFPAWWCREQGWSAIEEVWAAIETRGEGLLSRCDSPFWGRTGKRNPHPPERLFRKTERDGRTRAKSVFQVAGRGAVGTGSIRGMPHLRTLAKSGFSIWPFDDGWPRVFEIYPREMTGPVHKNRWADRHSYLFKRFPSQRNDLLERASGSEDAFDAAASALVMSEHASDLEKSQKSSDPEYRIEGRIWRPSQHPPCALP